MMRFLIFMSAVLMIMAPAPSRADNAPDYAAFSRLPVQHEGRIKPVDTLARNYLEFFSGGETIDGISAAQWLAQTIFNPGDELQRPLFRILKPQALGLSQRDDRHYSFAELSAMLSKKADIIARLAQSDPKQWTEDQQELMRLQEQSILYMQFLRSFSNILPLDIAIPPSLAKEWGMDLETPPTFESMAKYKSRLETKTKDILRRKGNNPDRYTPVEKSIVGLSFDLQSLENGGQGNVLFRVIPVIWDGPDSPWQSPWSVTETGKGSPESAKILTLWTKAAHRFIADDAADFNETLYDLGQAYKPYVHSGKMTAEIAYNTYRPLTIAMGGYLFALLLCAGASMLRRPSWDRAAFYVLGMAGAIHGAAIIARVYILDRPPVGTLYESILFVGALCVLISLILEMRRQDRLGILIGSIVGLLLLFTARGFDSEDTMKMLIAVLNTNFWLATHVLCITAGYGFCLVTSALAHIHLFRAGRAKNSSSLLPAMKTMGLIALLFTAVGTILGGIWADQSWGRFWGWDPKENGALLIVLWLVWVFHAHLSGHLKQIPMTALMAALSVVVALAWFGVNLLNVGLHSYGFITGVAASLAAFCLGEGALIGFLWYRAVVRKEMA